MNFIMSHQLSFFEINRYVIFEKESAPVPDRGSKFEVKNYTVDFLSDLKKPLLADAELFRVWYFGKIIHYSNYVLGACTV